MENSTSTFQKNINLLQKKDPDLASILLRIDASTLPFAPGFPQEKNLVDIGISPEEYLFSPHKAKEEIQNWWNTIDSKPLAVLFIYGTGLGFPYEMAKKWLDEKPQRHLVFLEDDRRMLVRLLETPLGTEMLSDPRVRIESFIFEMKEYEEFRKMLDTLAWYYVITQHKLVALPYYEKKKSKRFALLQQYFEDEFNEKILSARFRIDLNQLHNQNIYQNLLDHQNVLLQGNLKNSLKNVPAIICGAGPSLSKHLSQLKHLTSHGAIFAAGSSLFILDKQNITPHFTGVIDPKPPYRPYYLQTQFEIPTFYQNKASHEIVSFLHGTKVLCHGRKHSPIEEWIERKLSFPPPTILSGYTIGDFMTMVAAFLGCNPIILIGMDLAFTNDLYYASEISGPTMKKEGLIKTKDVHGNPIYTKRDWFGAARHLTDIANHYKDHLFLNATEGGIGFEDIAEISFKEAVEKHLSSTYDMQGLVHASLSQAAPFSLDKTQISPYLLEIKQSLERSLDFSQKMNLELEHMAKDFEKKTADFLTNFTGPYSFLEKKLNQEFTYTYFLEPYWKYMSVILQKTRDDMERELDSKGALWRLKKCEVDFYVLTAKAHLQTLEESIARD